MDPPFWENVIAAQFRHLAGSIGYAFSAAMPEPRGVASVKTMDAAKRRLFRPTAPTPG